MSLIRSLAVAGAVGTGLFVILKPKTARAATPTLPTTFDALFKARCSSIPVGYLRALAKEESNFNTDLIHPTSNATGLLQITRVVRESFNKRRDASITQTDLLDPATNITVACFQLRRIVRSYVINHPDTLAIDFRSRRWVELLTAGWNAGHSERSGVGFVVGELESRGFSPAEITVDAVFDAAEDLPQATRFLRIERRRRFAKEVADRAMQQLGVA